MFRHARLEVSYNKPYLKHRCIYHFTYHMIRHLASRHVSAPREQRLAQHHSTKHERYLDAMMSIHMDIHMYIHMDVHMYVHMDIHVYIHTYIQMDISDPMVYHRIQWYTIGSDGIPLDRIW